MCWSDMEVHFIGCHLMKVNKKLGHSRNEGNKTVKKEINEVLGEEDEGQDNIIKVFISTGI